MTISQEFRVRMPDDKSTHVTLSYDRKDPWAITMRIDTDNDWVFARSLLQDGLRQVAGLGDVRIWTAGGDMYMALESPDGKSLLRFYAATVRQFLNKTYELVPPNHETKTMNMDKVVKNLLKEAD